MRTLNIGLSPEAIAQRRNYIGGSDANIILGGDPRAIHDLWTQKTGRAQPADLSGVLPVILGQWTEELNRYWYERQTGRDVTSEGLVVTGYEWQSATLDGETLTEAGEPAVFEAKHVNAFSKIEDVVQRYMPQLHHNMHCAGRKQAVLSVFVGTLSWECYEVALDGPYLAALLEHEQAFWDAVQNDHPPVDLPAPPAVVLPSRFRTLDMTGSNEWASVAADWLTNRAAAKTFEAATKTIKAMVEPDVGLATGHGIQAKRSKAGALTISELKEKANAA